MIKAIIIDDEPWARKIIRSFGHWEDLGIEIVGEGENGLEAIDLMAIYQPDLMITDMEMSDMDGVGLLKHIEKEEKAMKIIVISGHDNFEYMKQAIRSKAIEYILKPIDCDELNDALKRSVHALLAEEDKGHLTFRDVFSVETIDGLMAYTKELHQGLQGVDFGPIAKVLNDMTKHLNARKQHPMAVKVLWDYLLPVIREEVMDVLKHSRQVSEAYQSLKGSISTVDSFEDLFGLLKTFIQLALHERTALIKASQKPVAELVKDYIDTAYKGDIRLSQVADRFFISKEYLSHTFKQTYGLTLGNYILKKKMDEAMTLIEAGKSHKEIAESLSYKDLPYFYKVFKKYYGKTPGECHPD